MYRNVQFWLYGNNRKAEITAVSGTIEDGEEPSQAAIRELREETGLIVDDSSRWSYLGGFNHAKSAVSKRHLFLVDVNGVDAEPKSTDGSYFEKNTKNMIADESILEFSSDLTLHLLYSSLKLKLSNLI